MKRVFITSIFRYWKRQLQMLVLLLLCPVFALGYATQDNDAHCSWLLLPEHSSTLACTVTNMEITYQSGCDDNGTQPDWTDDFYLANFKIFHTGANEGDIIEVVHTHLLEQPQEHALIDATEAANGISYLWANKMLTDINENNAVPGWVSIGTFTINIKDGNTGALLCTQNFTFNNVNHVRPCSVCTVGFGAWNSNPTSISCWPDEIPTGPCDDPLNYAPVPEHLGHTPLKYVKVILHFFQVADPNNPGQPHPNGPQHYSSEHIDVIKSWFSGQEGVNGGLMANLCAPTADPSPHIPDSRIRFVLEHGEEGKDIFFHPNTAHWAISTHG